MTQPSILGRIEDDPLPPLRLADIFDLQTATPPPLRFSAYDGSSSGPEDAAIGIHLANPRAAAFLATAGA